MTVEDIINQIKDNKMRSKLLTGLVRFRKDILTKNINDFTEKDRTQMMGIPNIGIMSMDTFLYLAAKHNPEMHKLRSINEHKHRPDPTKIYFKNGKPGSVQSVCITCNKKIMVANWRVKI